MEEATKLRESATDVAEAMSEIEGYMQRLKDMAIEVCSLYFAVYITLVTLHLPTILDNSNEKLGPPLPPFQ